MIWILLWAEGVAIGAISGAVDLQGAYSAALERTESVAVAEARTDQAAARLREARGSIFPALDLNGDYYRQEKPVNNSGSPDRTTARLSVTQPIFRGFQEFAALNSAKSSVAAREAYTDLARTSLYAQVAQAYYGVLAAEQDIRNVENQIELTTKRIGELQSRTRSGRTRRSELLSAQSQEALLKADLDNSRTQFAQAKEQFFLVTGLPRDLLLREEKDEIAPTLPPLATYLEKIENRPDIRALRSTTEAAEAGITVARAGHFPSVDFLGNWYLYRSSNQTDNNWDVELGLSFPIFQGGAISARVSEATAVQNEQELLLAQARRVAVQEIHSTYNTVAGGHSQLNFLGQAVRIARQSYNQLTRDYGFGLTSNLDVLQAQNDFLSAQRALDRTRFQLRAAWAALQAAIGEVPR